VDNPLIEHNHTARFSPTTSASNFSIRGKFCLRTGYGKLKDVPPAALESLCFRSSLPSSSRLLFCSGGSALESLLPCRAKSSLGSPFSRSMHLRRLHRRSGARTGMPLLIFGAWAPQEIFICKGLSGGGEVQLTHFTEEPATSSRRPGHGMVEQSLSRVLDSKTL